MGALLFASLKFRRFFTHLWNSSVLDNFANDSSIGAYLAFCCSTEAPTALANASNSALRG